MMGLLSRLLGKKTPSDIGGRVFLRGNDAVDVFIYDGTPLKGVKKGEDFAIDVIPGNVTMRSVATGTVWSSESDGGIAVGFNGYPIGFLGSRPSAVLQIAEKGYSVSIAAKRTGTYMKGIPSIVALMPERNTLKKINESLK